MPEPSADPLNQPGGARAGICPASSCLSSLGMLCHASGDEFLPEVQQGRARLDAPEDHPDADRPPSRPLARGPEAPEGREAPGGVGVGTAGRPLPSAARERTQDKGPLGETGGMPLALVIMVR